MKSLNCLDSSLKITDLRGVQVLRLVCRCRIWRRRPREAAARMGGARTQSFTVGPAAHLEYDMLEDMFVIFNSEEGPEFGIEINWHLG
jgi:hypothetical protein